MQSPRKILEPAVTRHGPATMAGSSQEQSDPSLPSPGKNMPQHLAGGAAVLLLAVGVRVCPGISLHAAVRWPAEHEHKPARARRLGVRKSVREQSALLAVMPVCSGRVGRDEVAPAFPSFPEPA